MEHLKVKNIIYKTENILDKILHKDNSALFCENTFKYNAAY